VATKSLSNAKQIGVACRIYAVDNDGKYPPNLAALVPDYLPDTSTFVSPYAPEEKMGYVYHPGLSDTSPPAAVLIEDKFSEREKRRIVVFADGSGKVENVPAKPEPK
jgi:hypothetical protein